MSITRIILFVIATSFILCGAVESDADNDFNLEKFLGIWYELGSMDSNNSSVIFNRTEKPCEWFNVKIEYSCAGCIKLIYGPMIDGSNPPTTLAFGTFQGNKLHIKSVQFEELILFSKTSDYEIHVYENEQALILRDKKNELNTKLLSRNRTYLMKTKMQFDAIAAGKGLVATYRHHSTCVPS